ncbi:ribonuclease HII [Haloparvum alkalitolerans]
MICIGVDEAGKGPVLGPMVAAAVRVDPETLPDDVDDSKRVAPARREELAAALRDREAVGVGIGVVEPAEIDAPDTDMNGLTVAAQARALADLFSAADDDGPGAEATEDDPPEVVVDAGDVLADRFGRRVREAVADRGGPDVDVTAEHGADESHPVVSAASVVAKVERDARMAAVAERHEADPGSGYPGDATTVEFLEAYVDEHGDVPDCARRSWRTCERLLDAAAQSGLDEF